MGWTDLFKSKKGPDLKPDPRIRWFGKLPTYADYYTSPSDADWAAEMNEWLMKGYEIYHSRALSRSDTSGIEARAGTDRLPLAGCVLRLPKSGMTAFASIQDYGGDMRGRHFPICFYVGYPTALWPAPSSGQVGEAVRTVDALMELRNDVAQHFRSPGRFESRFGDREVDLGGFEENGDADWRDKAKKIEMSEWFAAIRPALKIEDTAEWYRTLQSWGQNISTCDGESFEPTFRFPLAAAMQLEPQVTGWVRWLERRMDLKSRFLSLMLTSGEIEGVNYFTVIARPLVADDFLLVTSLGSTVSYVDDLTALGARGESTDGDKQLPRDWEGFVEG
ncbi:MAG TPA: hypothetical protein VNT79_10290 [Phycisphaerae bacterium]|nr:hypothetical protein [Phycisphaerae bacterium]